MPETVDSASDARTINNAVRHTYRVLSDEEKHLMVEVKDIGQLLLEKIESIGESDDLRIARIKAIEAVMWAVRHITA
jgi:hypothetical protein